MAEYLIPFFGLRNLRAMIFVDGENLAIRFGALLKADATLEPRQDAIYEPDTYIWSRRLTDQIVEAGGLIRTHYYTAIQGDRDTVDGVTNALKALGRQSPTHGNET